MTVRQGKLAVQIGAVVIVAAILIGVAAAIAGGGGVSGASGAPALILLLVVMAITWRRLKTLEAEHGADYAPPSSKNSRTLLLVAVAVAAVLTALAIQLVAR